MEAIYEERESTVEGVAGEVDAAEVELRVRGHLELVRRLAWKYRWTGLSLEELMSEGNVGLVEAARR
ncbi:MAG: RNA polymerase subunit sigma-32, partial [Myxococcaceae bacterium]